MSNTNENQSVAKTNINWYPGHMAKTKREISERLNLIDIVYEVVDARMPKSSKIKDIDDLIKNKKRIMIMTKSDLCDQKETKKFISYYESLGYRVVLLNLKDNSSLKFLYDLTKEIMKDEFERRKQKGLISENIRVLVMGVPNVGKSTLINKMVGKAKAGVGSKAGFTKQLSWIKVNQNIELLDSPGILWPKFDNQEEAHILASLSSIKEEVVNSFDISSFILKKMFALYPKQLEERYGLTSVSDDLIEEFDIVAAKRGALKKGGLVDYDKVCSIIIQDLQNGRLGNVTFDRIEE